MIYFAEKKKRLLGAMAFVIFCFVISIFMKTDDIIKPTSFIQSSAAIDKQDMGNEKKVAITFDDGPNIDYTGKLLKGLKERGVCATFFLLGSEIEKYPELVQQMYEDGHLIGTHSYQHVNLCNLTDEAAIEQIVKTNELLKEITGEIPLFIRPPFGCWRKDLDYETKMIEVLWDIDPLDWCTNNTGIIVNRVLKEVEDGDIILLHDASQSSVEAALQIIDQLLKDGYVFVTVEELLLN